MAKARAVPGAADPEALLALGPAAGAMATADPNSARRSLPWPHSMPPLMIMMVANTEIRVSTQSSQRRFDKCDFIIFKTLIIASLTCSDGPEGFSFVFNFI